MAQKSVLHIGRVVDVRYKCSGVKQEIVSKGKIKETYEPFGGGVGYVVSVEGKDAHGKLVAMGEFRIPQEYLLKMQSKAVKKI
jgi:hypothetical protein